MRFAFVMRVREGMEDQYRTLHAEGNPVNEAIRQACRESGISHYTLFMGGPTGRWIFGFFEAQNVTESMARLAAHPANAPWQEVITPLMEVPATFQGDGSVEKLTEVFHLD